MSAVAGHLDTGAPPGADRADAPTLLFLHGLGGTADAWEPQLRTFADAARCVAWTMPGYDTSPPPAEMSIASLADAAIALLEHLGVGRATVVGHSMGGYVAQELALRCPELVERLVLVATTAAFGKPGSRFNEEFLAARLAPLDDGRTPADLAPTVVDGLVGPATPAEARRAAVASMSSIGVDAYRAALGALVTWNASDRVPSLTMPVRCIAGELDSTAPPKAMAHLSEMIPGATLEVVPDVGHLLNLERPAAFDAALRRALAD